MNVFSLTVLAAERSFYEGDCVSLIIPTIDGQYGILADHSNMIGAVIPGRLKITTPEGSEILAAVSEGLVKVENNQVLILVDTAERPEDIDANRARHSMEEAKEALLQKRSIQDYQAAQAKLARAMNRLKVKEQFKW